jgi:HSP20 family protein
MDTNKQSQGASQRGQQVQQGQQAAKEADQQVHMAHGSIEGQQGSEGASGGAPASAGNVASSQRASGQGVGVLRPPVDVIEDATGITLIADMPGVAKENLNLRLEAQSLTIEGAMSLDMPADMEPRFAEVRHQHYERTFALSRELNGEQATAELNHGVLRIRIPKSQDAVPRKIPVNAA